MATRVLRVILLDTFLQTPNYNRIDKTLIEYRVAILTYLWKICGKPLKGLNLREAIFESWDGGSLSKLLNTVEICPNDENDD